MSALILPNDYSWVIPTADQLQQFSGEAISALYTDEAYSEFAIQMSADWLFLATGLAGWPISGFEQRLLTNAILQMAQALYLAQPFKNVLASPFASEKIGNYSYQKAAGAAANGMPIGLSWFDAAVQYFVGTNITEDSATRGMEDDNVWTTVGDAETEETHRQLLGPADLQPSPFGGEPIPVGYRDGHGGWGGPGWPQP